MRSDDWVPILTGAANRREQVGMRQGMLLSWDPSTGNNSVLVAGQTFTDLPVLASGSVAMAPGDIVALQRLDNSYFILGTIRNAGTGSLQGRSARVATLESKSAMSTAWQDLTTLGPTISDVYIGRSRQCLVLLSASMQAPSGEVCLVGFQVSGASTVVPAEIRGAQTGTPTPTTATGTILVTAADGLNEGLNTFQMKYSTIVGGVPGDCFFADRNITVIPF